MSGGVEWKGWGSWSGRFSRLLNWKRSSLGPDGGVWSRSQAPVLDRAHGGALRGSPSTGLNYQRHPLGTQLVPGEAMEPAQAGTSGTSTSIVEW